MSGSNIGSGLGNYRGLTSQRKLAKQMLGVTVDENTMRALHGNDTMEIFKTAIHKLAIEIERGTAEPRAEYDAAIERLDAIAIEARSGETAQHGSTEGKSAGRDSGIAREKSA